LEDGWADDDAELRPVTFDDEDVDDDNYSTRRRSGHGGGRGTGESWIPFDVSSCGQLRLSPDGAEVGAHCTMHPDCRMNRQLHKRGIGALLLFLKWGEQHPEATALQHRAPELKKDLCSLAYRERRADMRRWAVREAKHLMPLFNLEFKAYRGRTGEALGPTAEIDVIV